MQTGLALETLFVHGESVVDCWEGAALRSRLRRNPAPLNAMLDFYFRLTVVS